MKLRVGGEEYDESEAMMTVDAEGATIVEGLTKAGLRGELAVSIPDGTYAPITTAAGGGVSRVNEGPLSLLDPRVNAVGDGSTNNDAALLVARNLLSSTDGGTIFAPKGRYRFTTLAIDRPLTIIGEGRGTTTSAPFGGAQWATDAESGTVFESTALTGTAFDFTAAFKPLNLQSLVVKGIGDNTRTTDAIKVGSASTWLDVLVLNFKRGCVFGGLAQNNDFVHLRTSGCETGLDFGTNANANALIGYDSSSDTTGVKMTGCGTNSFFGGAIQGFTTGILLEDVSEEHAFYGVYFESSVVAAKAIWLKGPTSAPDQNRFIGCHYGDVGDLIVVDKGNGNEFVLTKTAPASITFAVGTTNNRVSGVGVTGVTDNGTNIVESRGGGGIALTSASVSTSGSLAAGSYVSPVAVTGAPGKVTFASPLFNSGLGCETAEAANDIVNFGVNDTRFGTQLATKQGGFLRFDSRAGVALSTWFVRPASGALALAFGILSNKNIGIGTDSEFGGGEAVVGISNCTVVPSTNTAAGGVIYVEGGVMKFRGSTGNIFNSAKQAAQADTSGATLAALETEVNGLKAKLRAAGLMA